MEHFFRIDCIRVVFYAQRNILLLHAMWNRREIDENNYWSSIQVNGSCRIKLLKNFEDALDSEFNFGNMEQKQ